MESGEVFGWLSFAFSAVGISTYFANHLWPKMPRKLAAFGLVFSVVLLPLSAYFILSANSETTPAKSAVTQPEGTVPPWLATALGEVGQKEIKGSAQNPRIMEYFASVRSGNNFQDDTEDWASAFAEWSFSTTGIAGPKNNDPAAWLIPTAVIFKRGGPIFSFRLI